MQGLSLQNTEACYPVKVLCESFHSICNVLYLVTPTAKPYAYLTFTSLEEPSGKAGIHKCSFYLTAFKGSEMLKQTGSSSSTTACAGSNLRGENLKILIRENTA